jgi:ABC-2 type transport system permease protein
LVATFLASVIGPLLNLPHWYVISPPHVPALPGGEVTAGPLVGLLAAADALIAVGLWALRRRDLAVA